MEGTTIPIPPGLQALLEAFTVAILRAQPDNLVKFSADYFDNLLRQQMKDEDKPSQLRKSEINFQMSAKKRLSLPDSAQPFDDKSRPSQKELEKRRLSVSSEKYDPEAESQEAKVVIAKTDEQRKRLKEAFKPILLFRSLNPEQINDIVNTMSEKTFEVGDKVIIEGEDGDNFYVIESGTYDVFVGGKKYGVYEDSGSFGELALLYNQPRAATIVATGRGSVWAMDRASFRRIVLQSAYKQRTTYEKFLENVPILQSLSQYERLNVADALTSIEFEEGTLIIKQGDTPADCMYFIEEGTVKIVVQTSDDSEHMEVSELTKGGYFGERALITKQPRKTSAYAVGQVKCAKLDVEAFERLLGPCMDIMKRHIESYDVELINLLGSKAGPVDSN